MRRSNFEKQDIGLVCGSCKTRTTKKLLWLRANNQFVCPNCGAKVDVNSHKLIAGFERAQRAFDDFLKRLSGDPN